MIKTVGGYWDPIIWIIAFIVIFILAYMIRAIGKKEYRKGEQIKPFLSGMEEPSKEAVHIRASNLYWGFVEALKSYYETMKKMHTGIINDYVAWFVGITAIIFIAVFIVGII